MSTVNEKMTAIANGIRTLSGETSPLTLDDMATELNSINNETKTTNDYLNDMYQKIVNNGMYELLASPSENNSYVEQNINLSTDLRLNLFRLFYRFTSSPLLIQNGTSHLAVVYYNNPLDFSFTSMEIPPSGNREINFIQNSICLIIFPTSGLDSIHSEINGKLTIIDSGVFTYDMQKRYVIFQGTNISPTTTEKATIAFSNGSTNEPF